MAWLVVMMVDNSPFEKGHIVSVRHEDNPNFGIKTMKNPWFRIVHCPDMSYDEADGLCKAQFGFLREGASPLLKMRANKLDVNKLKKADKDKIETVRDYYKDMVEPIPKDEDGNDDRTKIKYKKADDLEITKKEFMKAVVSEPIPEDSLTNPNILK